MVRYYISDIVDLSICKKEEKIEEKKEKNYLHIPSYHASWGTCMDVTPHYIEYI